MRWKELMPLLKEKNVLERRVTKFLTKNLKRKSLLALNGYRKRKQREARIVQLFKSRRDSLTQAMCLSALFDQSCDTKLRVAHFCHFMTPIIQGSKAMALARWCEATTQKAMVDMAD